MSAARTPPGALSSDRRPPGPTKEQLPNEVQYLRRELERLRGIIIEAGQDPDE